MHFGRQYYKEVFLIKVTWPGHHTQLSQKINTWVNATQGTHTGGGKAAPASILNSASRCFCCICLHPINGIVAHRKRGQYEEVCLG